MEFQVKATCFYKFTFDVLNFYVEFLLSRLSFISHAKDLLWCTRSHETKQLL